MTMDLASEVGDFGLRNAHGIYSYHLANVVDDVHLGITHVVRGADLRRSRPPTFICSARLAGMRCTTITCHWPWTTVDENCPNKHMPLPLTICPSRRRSMLFLGTWGCQVSSPVHPQRCSRRQKRIGATAKVVNRPSRQ